MDLVDKAKNKAKHVAGKLAEFRKPEANIIEVGCISVSRECITYKANVSVTNPCGVPFSIHQISYVLKSAGRVIASGTVLTGSLKGHNATKLDFPVKVPYSVLVSLVKDIAKEWHIDYDLELGLLVDVPIIGNLTIQVSKKGVIEFLTFSDVWNSIKKI